MKPLRALLLLLLLALAPSARPAEARCPCPGQRHAHRHAVAYRWVRVPLRRQHQIRHRYRPARRHVAAAKALPTIMQVSNTEPIFLGELFVKGNNAPFLSRPDPAATVLALLPKRTDVVDMGLVQILGPNGRVIRRYHKVEAPNGKSGFVDARWLSSTPPVW